MFGQSKRRSFKLKPSWLLYLSDLYDRTVEPGSRMTNTKSRTLINKRVSDIPANHARVVYSCYKPFSRDGTSVE